MNQWIHLSATFSEQEQWQVELGSIIWETWWVSLSFRTNFMPTFASLISSLAYTSYSSITFLPRSKKTRPSLLSSSFPYLERKWEAEELVEIWFCVCVCSFLSFLCVKEWRGRWESEARSFRALVMNFGMKTIVSVDQEEKQFEQGYASL